MSRWSAERKTHLLTVPECAAMFGVSEKTIKRRLGAPGVYSEMHTEVRADGLGGSKSRYIDPVTLGLPMPASVSLTAPLRGTPARDTQSCEGQAEFVPSSAAEIVLQGSVDQNLRGTSELALAANLRGTPITTDPLALILPARPDEQALYGDISEAGKARHRALLPILNATPKSAARGAAVRAYALANDLTPRAVRQQVQAIEQQGLAALVTRKRADAGGYHIPQISMQVIAAAWMSNPATTSGRMLQRTLVRAVPEAMQVLRADGTIRTITAATVIRVKNDLQKHPLTRLMFTNADEQKEYLRTYSGEVVALHANAMWQQDMTRCDIWVFDPETGRIFRPRVQAIIDVYSGCIMSLAFSTDEDQVQADLAFLRALSKKGGPLADLYPLYGKPERMYIDNGKTYSSEHFHRVCAELGIELIHSLPRVSHTRGKIERFFGTLHGLEKALPGYAGENAVTSAKEELKKLRNATERWMETGRDPGQGERLLTLQEYQSAVLSWLIVDYHKTVLNGLTRLEHFRATAPASSLLEFDPTELLLLFAHRYERTVRPDGTITLNNTLWTLLDGTLGNYRNMKVLVLHDRFAWGDDTHAIVWRERNGNLRMLGQAAPAPSVAGSIEAADHRRNTKAAKQALLREAKTIKQELTDPAMTVSAALQKELSIVPVQPIVPSGRARIAAVNPDPAPDLGEWDRMFDGSDLGGDLDAVLKRLSEGN